MKTWQIEPNAVHYTREKLYCDKCKKQYDFIIEIFDIGFFCIDCFVKDLRMIYAENDLEYITIDSGGKTTKDNLQTLCFKCNHGKGIII